MKIYTITEQAWQAIFKACEEATTSIWIEQYLIENDQISRQLCRILGEKAKQGVEVKCLFDAFGSFYFSNSKIPAELAATGAQVEFFNWLWPFSPQSQTLLYFRNHRRILIIDGKTAFTGGLCFGDKWRNVRETHMQISNSPVVEKMKEIFTIDWFRSKRRTLRLKEKVSAGADGYFFFTSVPLPNKRFLYYRLIDAIRRARTYIYLTTPYFLPDHKITKALVKAAARGVDVRILLPKHSNHKIVDIGARSYFEYFLDKGVRIFRYNAVLHAKTGVIDDSWATVGSLNLDNISLRYNLEGNIVGLTKPFTEEIKAHFMHDLTNAEELTPKQWRMRSIFDVLSEFLIWPIRKLL